MASSPFPFPSTVNHHGPHLAPPRKLNCSAASTINSISFRFYSPKINFNHSFPFRRNFWLGRCRATTSPPNPPPDKEPLTDSGVTSKDSLQIFFAVAFWMSLFFWSCVWDGGKPNKGPPFKK